MSYQIHISSCQIANIEDRLGPIRETISESLERIHRVRNATSDLMSGYTLYERHLEAHCAACNALSTFDDVIDPPTAPTALSQVLLLLPTWL